MKIFLPSFLAALSLSASALAAGPYVTVQDDGTIENTPYTTDANANTILNKIIDLYQSTGSPIPDVISLWTAFPFDGNPYETDFLPLANTVDGIGLDAYFGPGVSPSPLPPLSSVLIHNDVTQLPKRAALQGAPVDTFAQYLFLLEFLHNWGPVVNVPGTTPAVLTGDPYHWSFWLDAGGSPGGGNRFQDNGDGTFTTLTASTLTYAPLDLYLMGLVPASEVPPFGVLENAVPPASAKDSFTGQGLTAQSFPWFGAPITITATRATFTIDDIITANGTRTPAYGASPTTWSVGLVLVVPKSATAADVAAAQATFDPIASSFGPAFQAATSSKGSLTFVTESAAGGAGGAGGGAGAGSLAGAGGEAGAAGGSGGAGTGGQGGGASGSPDGTGGSTAAGGAGASGAGMSSAGAPLAGGSSAGSSGTTGAAHSAGSPATTASAGSAAAGSTGTTADSAAAPGGDSSCAMSVRSERGPLGALGVALSMLGLARRRRTGRRADCTR